MSEIGRPPGHTPPAPAGPTPAAAAGDDSHQGEQNPGRQPASAKVVDPPAPAPRAPAVAFAGSLAALGRGAELVGQIVGQAEAGQAILRTDHGTFLVAGLTPEAAEVAPAAPTAPTAAEVTLRLRILTVGTGLGAALIEQDGRALHPPPAVTLTLTQPAAPPATASAAPAIPPGAAPLVPGQIFQTEIDPPPRPAANAAPGAAAPGQPAAAAPAATARPATAPAPLDAGSRLTLRLIAVLPPAGAETQRLPAGAQPPPAAGPTTPAAPVAPTAAAAPTTLAATAPHLAQRAYGAAEAHPAPVTGTVAGAVNDAGATLLKVDGPQGPFTIRTAAPLALGTRLAFDLVALEPPIRAPRPGPMLPPSPAGAASPAGTAESLPLVGFKQSWPALSDALAELGHAAPEVARQVADQRLPRPNARLTTALLLFLSALRGGDVAGWLGGEAARALARGGGATLDRLRDDFGRLGHHGADPGPGDWRTFVLPLLAGPDLATILLFVRDHGPGTGGDEADAEPEGSRFVVELSLSRLGELQLDGFVHAHRFDLIVRSAEPLGAMMQRDIAAIFAEGRDLAGLGGEIAFQTGTPFPVSPLAESDGAGPTAAPREAVVI